MSANEIHAFDTIITFEVQILQEDNTIYPLNGAQVLEFHFQKPDGTIMIRPANYVTDGSDGKIKYTTNEMDLDQIGRWKYQIYIERGPVIKHSDVGKFRVYPNLPY
jgi:hypothetical protein